MENKNNTSENLEEIAPFLSKIEKKNHFSTPNNYFEVLPEVISSKNLINKRLNISFDKLSYRVLVPVLSFIVLFIVVYNFNNNNSENELTNEQLSDLIIEEDYGEIDDYLVYETYAEIIDESYNEFSASKEDENEWSTDMEEYINYLIENDIDINSIIEEL